MTNVCRRLPRAWDRHASEGRLVLLLQTISQAREQVRSPPVLRPSPSTTCNQQGGLSPSCTISSGLDSSRLTSLEGRESDLVMQPLVVRTHRRFRGRAIPGLLCVSACVITLFFSCKMADNRLWMFQSATVHPVFECPLLAAAGHSSKQACKIRELQKRPSGLVLLLESKDKTNVCSLCRSHAAAGRQIPALSRKAYSPEKVSQKSA